MIASLVVGDEYCYYLQAKIVSFFGNRAIKYNLVKNFITYAI